MAQSVTSQSCHAEQGAWTERSAIQEGVMSEALRKPSNKPLKERNRASTGSARTENFNDFNIYPVRPEHVER